MITTMIIMSKSPNWFLKL